MIEKANSEAVKGLRLESNRVSFKRNLENKLENRCANCGTDISLEHHHIVPLSIGGTNRTTNIVVLCHRCHQLAHGAKNIRDICKAEKTGRKRREPPKDYESIIEKYLNGEIGRKDCERRLGLPEKAKLAEQFFFKDYLSEHNIVSYKNRVDMLNTEKCKRRNHTGEFIAKVIYADGTQRVRYIK